MINGYGDLTTGIQNERRRLKSCQGGEPDADCEFGALLAQGSDEADAHRNSAKWRDHGHSNRGRAIA